MPITAKRTVYTARMSIDLAAIEHAVASFAARERLVAAYLHGSAATGRMDSESDIDIALLPSHTLSTEERWKLRLRCIGFLMERFPKEEEKFDVIILQDVPLLLRYNVIRRGSLLFEHDRSLRLDFEISTERQYEDEEHYLRREADITLEHILSSSRQ